MSSWGDYVNRFVCFRSLLTSFSLAKIKNRKRTKWYWKHQRLPNFESEQRDIKPTSEWHRIRKSFKMHSLMLLPAFFYHVRLWHYIFPTLATLHKETKNSIRPTIDFHLNTSMFCYQNTINRLDKRQRTYPYHFLSFFVESSNRMYVKIFCIKKFKKLLK